MPNRIKYSVPVVNLSNNYLTRKERVQSSFGLERSFMDKNRHIKKNLAVNLEIVTQKVAGSLDKKVQQDFHEFLRVHTDILTKKVSSTKDDRYQNPKRVINNKTLALVPGHKDLCVIIMKIFDYIAKMQIMIEDGITCSVYTPTTDTTLKDLKTFRDFLYRNFKDHQRYEKMLLTSSQHARLYIV